METGQVIRVERLWREVVVKESHLPNYVTASKDIFFWLRYNLLSRLDSINISLFTNPNYSETSKVV